MATARKARGGVLVLGGGFAGSYVARLLGRSGATIVSRENFMLYTPMLPEAASGTLEPRHVVVPLRQMCRHAELLLGTATALDEERRIVSVETADAGSFDVEYDQLVLAPGAVTRTFPVPGLTEHALGFKDLADAIHLRNRVLRELEAADSETDDAAAAHLTFVFVGAGYAGVEALAELADLAADALRYYPRLRGVRQRWVLVDAAPKILPEIPSRLGEYAARELTRRGVEIHVGTTLESIGPDEALLSNGERIPTRTVVWTTGVKASPLLGAWGLPLDERGRAPATPLPIVSAVKQPPVTRWTAASRPCVGAWTAANATVTATAAGMRSSIVAPAARSRPRQIASSCAARRATWPVRAAVRRSSDSRGHRRASPTKSRIPPAPPRTAADHAPSRPEKGRPRSRAALAVESQRTYRAASRSPFSPPPSGRSGSRRGRPRAGRRCRAGR